MFAHDVSSATVVLCRDATYIGADFAL